MSWQSISDLVARMLPNRSRAPDVGDIRAAGAPDWVTPDAEGWIDELGWGLIGPAVEAE